MIFFFEGGSESDSYANRLIITFEHMFSIKAIKYNTMILYGKLYIRPITIIQTITIIDPYLKKTMLKFYALLNHILCCIVIMYRL